MKKMKMKNIAEANNKNSPLEQGLKKLAGGNWEYVFDYGSDQGYIENKNNGIQIYVPYDAEHDTEHFVSGKAKDKWSVQMGDEEGKTNKIFWYPTSAAALRGIKSEVKPKAEKIKGYFD